jgi:hypothetical protein
VTWIVGFIFFTITTTTGLIIAIYETFRTSYLLHQFSQSFHELSSKQSEQYQVLSFKFFRSAVSFLPICIVALTVLTMVTVQFVELTYELGMFFLWVPWCNSASALTLFWIGKRKAERKAKTIATSMNHS